MALLPASEEKSLVGHWQWLAASTVYLLTIFSGEMYYMLC